MHGAMYVKFALGCFTQERKGVIHTDMTNS